MFIIYAVVFLIPIILYWIHQRRVEEDEKVGVPGPKGWPLIGATFELHPYLKTQNIFKKFHEYHEIYGDTYQIRMGPVKMIVSRDPKITEAIVNNPKFVKSIEYKMLKPWLGDSLVISEGEKWHKMRKLITPAFHFQILERFIPIFEEKVKIMIENIKTEMNNSKGIDVFPKYHALTLDIISETSMGVQLNVQRDSQSKFMETNEKVVNIVEERVFSGFLSIDWIFRLTPLYKTQIDCITYINSFVDNVIEERRKKLINENNNQTAANADTKKRPALLDILLQSQIDGIPLSNEDIQSEVKTFMFAGHDTTANTLSFTTYLIAKHPESQTKLFDEIKLHGFHKRTDSLSIRDLSSLSYMDNVIKESLRLFPPAVMVSKRSHEDMQIGNVFVPAETTISTNIYSSHRSEKYFKDPERFNPDRFGDEITTEDRNPYVFQPFSSGLRNCIGQKFGMLEMKTVLVNLLSEFQLELADEKFKVDPVQSGTLKSRNGAPLKFKTRV